MGYVNAADMNGELAILKLQNVDRLYRNPDVTRPACLSGCNPCAWWIHEG